MARAVVEVPNLNGTVVEVLKWLTSITLTTSSDKAFHGSTTRHAKNYSRCLMLLQ